ncbi:hypothetical protein ILUMI_21311 [Ignelater luminosus]|uniref:Uncharacterized protein n=1 Tax=Ignelater luminosus TaxID=2038154 RepID=A0A8K0G3S8_IGNLU|nr:hypothetical protein ILUMI_21311 [Ignelater luminosus]
MNGIILLFGIVLSLDYTWGSPTKRCANMFDEGCINGGVGGAGRDEEWIKDPGNTPGKRCANMFDEGCINGGIGGSGRDEEWIKDPGNTPGKRCANMFDEGCINEGIGGAGSDEEWIKNPGNTPGKRNLLFKNIPRLYSRSVHKNHQGSTRRFG